MLFYVQHQFEDVYWESSERWSYADAALRGQLLPEAAEPFQFFTGNIGLHHVHHLSAKVPNYNLQRAHDENEIFPDVPVLTVRDGLRSIRLKLIDPDSGRLVTFAQGRAIASRPRTTAAPATAGARAEPAGGLVRAGLLVLAHEVADRVRRRAVAMIQRVDTSRRCGRQTGSSVGTRRPPSGLLEAW